MVVQLTSHEISPWLILKLKGRVDSVNSGRVLSAIRLNIGSEHHYSALDMTHVEFIGLSVLKELLDLARDLKSRSGELVLVGPSSLVRRHIDSFAGHSNLRIFRDMDELKTGMCLRARSEFNQAGSVSYF